MAKFVSDATRYAKSRVETVILYKYGVEPGELNSNSRSQHVSIARFIAFFLLKKHFHMSASMCGQLYGKDHTSVLHGLKRVKEMGLDKEVEGVDFSTYPQA